MFVNFTFFCDLYLMLGNCVGISVQKLELQRHHQDDNDAVRGQIVISLISRDRAGTGPQVTDCTSILAAIPRDPDELPEGYVSIPPPFL